MREGDGAGRRALALQAYRCDTDSVRLCLAAVMLAVSVSSSCMKSSSALAAASEEATNERVSKLGSMSRVRCVEYDARSRSRVHISIGVACEILPTSSSVCMIFLMRACVQHPQS